MDILFHLGAHATDDGLLIRSILRNRGKLAEEGIGVPGPGRYRELLGEVSTRLRGAAADADTEAMLLEMIRDDDTADRIVLSNENFLCRSSVVLSSEGLYAKAEKSRWLRKCFPSHNTEFALGLRNTATMVPALLAQLPEPDRSVLLAEIPLDQLLWADVVAEIVEANPGCRILVWRHEDSPYIWSELVKEFTGHDPYISLDGTFDMIEQVMSTAGVARLKEFLEAHPDLTETRRRQAIAAFLDAHPKDQEPETAIALPGWTPDITAGLTQMYDEDVAKVAALPGVTFLAP